VFLILTAAKVRVLKWLNEQNGKNVPNYGVFPIFLLNFGKPTSYFQKMQIAWYQTADFSCFFLFLPEKVAFRRFSYQNVSFGMKPYENV
tara:strand:- start:4687 stop:4953 length:267 start_codon:yes stop_codon:yes gene_type:complete